MGLGVWTGPKRVVQTGEEAPDVVGRDLGANRAVPNGPIEEPRHCTRQLLTEFECLDAFEGRCREDLGEGDVVELAPHGATERAAEPGRGIGVGGGGLGFTDDRVQAVARQGLEQNLSGREVAVDGADADACRGER